ASRTSFAIDAWSNLFPSVGVRSEVQLPPTSIGYVGIELGRGQIRVSKHFLHGSEVGTALQQMRGEGMSQEMRMNALRLDARLVEPDRLADPQPGAVEELDERTVAERARRRSGGRVDEALRLAGRQRLRQRAPAARQLELRGGIVRPRTEQHLVAVEGADRS